MAASISSVEHFDMVSYLNRVEVGLVLLGAIFVTLIYDLPMQNIKMVIFKAGLLDGMENKDEGVVIVEPEVANVGEKEVTEEVVEKGSIEINNAEKEKEIEAQIDDAVKEAKPNIWDDIK
jgi:hypothetical protein